MLPIVLFVLGNWTQIFVSLFVAHYDNIGTGPLLVGGLNPSEKYESVGMIIPNLCKNNPNVPNHQPDYQDTNYWVPKHLRLAWSAVSNTRNGKLLHNYGKIHHV